MENISHLGVVVGVEVAVVEGASEAAAKQAVRTLQTMVVQVLTG